MNFSVCHFSYCTVFRYSFFQCCGSGILDPGKYLGLQRSNLKNYFNPGLRAQSGKVLESIGLKFLVVQEKKLDFSYKDPDPVKKRDLDQAKV